MGMAAILVMWPVEQVLASPSHGGYTWNVASISQWGVKEMFKIDEI